MNVSFNSKGSSCNLFKQEVFNSFNYLAISLCLGTFTLHGAIVSHSILQNCFIALFTVGAETQGQLGGIGSLLPCRSWRLKGRLA